MNRVPTLPPIPWQLVPITPLPDVTESNSAEVWALFESAQRALDNLKEKTQ